MAQTIDPLALLSFKTIFDFSTRTALSINQPATAAEWPAPRPERSVSWQGQLLTNLQSSWVDSRVCRKQSLQFDAMLPGNNRQGLVRLNHMDRAPAGSR